MLTQIEGAALHPHEIFVRIFALSGTIGVERFPCMWYLIDQGEDLSLIPYLSIHCSR